MPDTYKERRSETDFVNVMAGLVLFGLGCSRRLGRMGSTAAVLVGASKVAQGLTGYSPMKALSQTMTHWREQDRKQPLGDVPRSQRAFPWAKQPPETAAKGGDDGAHSGGAPEGAPVGADRPRRLTITRRR